MTSSQAVMAHNVPRKIEQQFQFFVFSYADKSSNRHAVFFVVFLFLFLFVPAPTGAFEPRVPARAPEARVVRSATPGPKRRRRRALKGSEDVEGCGGNF